MTETPFQIAMREQRAEQRERLARLKADRPDYDRAAYNRGWKASGGEGSFALFHADVRHEVDAWYDGYYDYAAGRGKWHRPCCDAHHNGPGGCGEA